MAEIEDRLIADAPGAAFAERRGEWGWMWGGSVRASVGGSG